MRLKALQPAWCPPLRNVAIRVDLEFFGSKHPPGSLRENLDERWMA
jgi:hypothetical protein